MSNENQTAKDRDHDADKRQKITEVQDKLDAEADDEGLAAEAGRGEETGLSEG